MPTRVIDAFQRTASATPNEPALMRRRNGAWETTTWSDYHTQVRAAARALMALGLEPGEHVTIIGYNCPEWFIANLAAIAAGGVPAGIYITNTADQCRFVAQHCEARVAFVEDAEQLAKFRAIREALPRLAAIVMMHDAPDAPGAPHANDVLSWNEFLRAGEAVTDDALNERIAAQRADDVCTLIYTSGTTGVPKAVMLTHTNLTWVAEQANALVGVGRGDVVVSYLPLSHIAEQMFSLYNSTVLGACIWFAESVDALGDTLRAARPHLFLAVPRVWEKMQARMEAVAATSPPMRRRIAAWARRVGLRGQYAMQRGGRRPVLYSVADRLVFSKVRAALGLDRARILVTGAAPIGLSTLEFFLSLGLPICEVYGMSESTGVASASVPPRIRTGSAGPVVPGAELRLATDGEICIRGPHVFAGYYKDPLATSEVLDADGWLHSGDVGTIDEEGFLRITDRKKELIITAGGENIAPQLVEGELRSIGIVSQAVVVGDRRRYLSVLLTLDPAKLPAVASLAGSAARTPAEAAECARFGAYLQAEIDGVNRRLSRVQTVKRFAVLPAELTVDGGELTPTLKLKRKSIAEKYAHVIDGLYTDA